MERNLPNSMTLPAFHGLDLKTIIAIIRRMKLPGLVLGPCKQMVARISQKFSQKLLTPELCSRYAPFIELNTGKRPKSPVKLCLPVGVNLACLVCSLPPP